MGIIILAIFLPVLFLVSCVALNLHLASILTVWPMTLLDLAGFLNNPEAFAHKYIDASLLFSLLVQSMAIYLILRLVEKRNALSQDT